MKAFKEWAGPGFYYGKDPLNRPILEAKRKGWKAALKWVLSLREQELYTTLCDIEQELND